MIFCSVIKKNNNFDKLLFVKKISTMNYILFDDSKKDLLPFTYLRPVADIRIGIMTIKEKWELFLRTQVSVLVDSYLSKKYPANIKTNNVLINGSMLPSDELISKIMLLTPGQALVDNEVVIAFYVPNDLSDKISIDNLNINNYEKVNIECEYIKLNFCWDIFVHNKAAMYLDFKKITENRISQEIDYNNNWVTAGENIFIEEGAQVRHAFLNASEGIIYIGKNAIIQEGSMLRGPIAICEGVTVRMGTKVYDNTTIGPYSKVGGELSNSVIFGFSNKAHDGFLGHSVIGEWCNIGADTNTSNLKNDYSAIKMWNYNTGRFINTGLQFCGLMMGDHSKCGINSMFNSGTVIGINSNVFGAGYPRHFVPSFSWGSPVGGFESYLLSKAVKTAEIVMARRNVSFLEEDAEIFNYVHNLTYVFRY